MNEEELIGGDDVEHGADADDLEDDLDLEGNPKKKKDLIDEDTESLEDLEEDELDDEEEPFDDVDEQ